jgi:SpoIVB peptidase S55
MVVRTFLRSVTPAVSGRAMLAGICVSALVVSLLVTAPARAAVPCAAPPQTFPVSQIVPGMTGIGHTVIKGTAIEQFNVEILGVLPDYIFLGIDIIVAEMTGPASLVQETGGAVAGMSGSPVYIDGRLAGALAWAVAEDRHIFGITAAEDMVGIFDLEDAAGGSMPSRISLPRSVIETARASGTMLSDSAALETLPVPLGVSGLGSIPLAEIEESFARRGMNVTAFRSGTVTAPTAGTIDPTHFAPGGGLGVALSYGDISYGGFGTTTAVCGDVALGFGHPMFWGQGDVLLGMTGVDVLAIDNGTFWGRKIGKLTETHGILTQDRFAGVAGVFGIAPTLVPITSDVSSPDTGLSRQGLTEVAWDDVGFVAEVGYYHTFTNFRAVLQSDSPGTLDFAWTIQGEREDSSSFTVENRWFDTNDYSAASGTFRLAEVLYALAYNRFEPIEITSVDVSGTITGEDLTTRIGRIRVSSPLQPSLKARDVIRAAPGDRITIEATLESTTGGPDRVATMIFKVPRGARGFDLVRLSGGKGRFDVFDRRIRSLDELLDVLNGGDHRNDLIAKGFGSGTSEALDVKVTGRGSFTVRIVR